MEDNLEKLLTILRSGEVLKHHACGLCGYMTNIFMNDDIVYFDPGCDCTGGASPNEMNHSELKFYTDQPGWCEKWGINN